jgi:fused signal recognition particle receptor
VTKLDGTAKGGGAGGHCARSRPGSGLLHRRGRTADELETFNAREFAQALLA